MFKKNFLIIFLLASIPPMVFAGPPPGGYLDEELYPNIVQPELEIGTFGPNLGEMNNPVSVTFLDSETFIVAECFNQRLQVWSTEGNPIKRLYGFKCPQGVARIDENRFAVIDSHLKELLIYSLEGKILDRFRSEDFITPSAVAYRNNVVYVSDGSGKIILYDIGLKKPIRTIQPDEQPPPQFAGLAVKSNGSIFVTDTRNHFLWHIGPDGNLIKKFGGWGSYSGMFATPIDVSLLRNELYVADRVNHRVQVVKTTGEFSFQFGRHPPKAHEGNGRVHYPSSLDVSPDGKKIIVCESIEHRCQIFSSRKVRRVVQVNDSAWWEKATRFHYGTRTATTSQVEDTSKVIRQKSQNTEIVFVDSPVSPPLSERGASLPRKKSAVTSNSKANFMHDLMVVSEPDTHSVLVFKKGSLKNKNQRPELLTRFGGLGNKPGQFNLPAGIGIDAKNHLLYVSDARNHRVQAFKVSEGGKNVAFVKSFGKVGRKKGHWFEPSHPKIMKNGNLLITDIHHGRIQIFDSDGNFKYQFGEGTLVWPIDTTLSRDERFVYVVDRALYKVFVYTIYGKYIREFGGPGPQKDKFVLPFGIAVDSEGFLFVSDQGNNRIKKFDQFGQLQMQWGRWGTGPGEFYKPKGVTIDEHDRLYVMDFGNHRGQIFKTDGTFIEAFGIGEKYIKPYDGQEPLAKSPIKNKFKVEQY